MGSTVRGTVGMNEPSAVDVRERELAEVRRNYFRGKGSLEDLKRLEKDFPIPGKLRLEVAGSERQE